MKKLYILLLICLSVMMVSCANNRDDTNQIFKFAISSPIKNVIENRTVTYATTTNLYIQDNDNKNYVLGMAKSMPIDVTSQYVNEKWNIKPGEVERAWKIELRDDLCWENGEKITAQDFIDTIAITYNCGFSVIKGSYYNKQNVDAGSIDINDLGIKAIENSLILIYDTEWSLAKICKNLSESSFNLVHKKTYDDCFVRDERGNKVLIDGNRYLNEYGTSIDKYLSYGPYKLEEMNQNKVRLIKNKNWFGYKNLSKEYYQTDEIVYEYLEDYSNSYDLLVEEKYHYIDVGSYLRASKANSFNNIDEKYIQVDSYNTPLVKLLMINPDYEYLLEKQEQYENVNYTILCIPEFRQALIYSLGWSNLSNSLEKQANSTNYNYLSYCLHPFYTLRTEINKYTGEYFHESDEFQNLHEEYYSEIFGFKNCKEKSIELFNEAYKIALNENYLTENDVIHISFSAVRDIAGESEVIIEQWKQVISETVLADKVKFEDPTIVIPNQVPYMDIYWWFSGYGDFGIEGAIKAAEDIDFPKYLNKELSINFDRIIDIDGKVYNNISLATTINDWVGGFKNKTIKTNIILDGQKN